MFTPLATGKKTNQTNKIPQKISKPKSQIFMSEKNSKRGDDDCFQALIWAGPAKGHLKLPHIFSKGGKWRWLSWSKAFVPRLAISHRGVTGLSCKRAPKPSCWKRSGETRPQGCPPSLRPAAKGGMGRRTGSRFCPSLGCPLVTNHQFSGHSPLCCGGENRWFCELQL